MDSSQNDIKVRPSVESAIPMDEIVEAMVRIGRSLPRGLRETAEGGLATTETGRAIAQRLKQEMNQRRAEKAALMLLHDNRRFHR